MIFLVSCAGPSTESTVELAQASQKVIFAATEALGPHQFQVVSTRTEVRSGEVEQESTETLDIIWSNWDSFSFVQTVDSELTLQVVVTEGSCWKKMYSGEWEVRPDAEPYRVQLRQKWGVWDRMTQPFQSGLEFVSQAEEQIDGRLTQHYSLEYVPPETTMNDSNLKPESIEGNIWVDTQTAVRLLGDIHATLVSGTYRKTQTLKLSRTNIDRLDPILPPDAPRLSPELQRFMQPPEERPEPTNR